MSAKKRPELRIYLDTDIERQVRIVAAIRDLSISSAVTEALEDWLRTPENQRIIERHRLDELDDPDES